MLGSCVDRLRARYAALPPGEDGDGEGDGDREGEGERESALQLAVSSTRLVAGVIIFLLGDWLVNLRKGGGDRHLSIKGGRDLLLLLLMAAAAGVIAIDE